MRILNKIIPDLYDNRRIRAKELIKNGYSKQEAYIQLKQEFGTIKGLSTIIRYIPSTEGKKRYSFLNYLLILCLSILFLIYTITSLNILFMLIYITLIIISIKYLLRYYLYISGISAFIVFVTIILYFQEDLIIINTVLSLLFQIPTLIIPYFLVRKLSPPPNKISEVFFDKFGISREIVRYEFSD